MSTAEAASADERRAFASFSIRSFRFQWSADMVSAWAVEMETLILGWFVLVETDSAFQLAIFGGLRFIGTLLSPMFGVVADRVSRRAILIGMRTYLGVQAVAIMALGLSGSLTPWHAFAFGAAGGLIRPCEMVLRQAIIADTVPRPMLMNALGFARTTMDSARIVGALLGAGLLSVLGIGYAYIGVAALHLASAALSRGIADVRAPRPAAARPLRELKLGLDYIRASRPILTIMYLAVLVNLTAFPITQGLLPAVARDLYGLDENGLAHMLAAAALGGLLGSLLMAVILRAVRPEPLMVAGAVAWHVCIVAFSQAPTLGVALVLLGLVGAANSAAMVPMSAVLMGLIAPEFRGRVMGVRLLAVYALPLGLLAAGAGMERIGIPTTLAAMGATGLVVTAALAVTSLRRM